MPTQKFPEDLHAEMAKVRAASRKLRREAFIPYRPIVCGFLLEPVTLRTYGMLIAFENAFAFGSLVSIEDVANFVWVHHPDFGQLNRRGRRRVYRGVRRHLQRGMFRTNDFLRNLRSWMPPWLHPFVTAATRETVLERFNTAGREIARLIEEATDDLPVGEEVDPEESEPALFSWQARVYNSLRRELGMSFEEASGIPLKTLCQILRETRDHSSDGRAMQYTLREAALIAEDLRRATEKVQAELTPEERERYAEIHRRDAAAHV